MHVKCSYFKKSLKVTKFVGQITLLGDDLFWTQVLDICV